MSQYDADDVRHIVFKKDVTQGLCRVEGKHIAGCEHTAPLFAIAFDLQDKTAVPELTRRAIWLLNNAYSCLLRGEEGAYIQGIEGLPCLMRNKAGVDKTIIQRNVNYDEVVALEEMNMQLRIHVAEGEGGVVEHYMVLVVASPLAFSIRKAVWNTVHACGRGPDGTEAENRRIWWNRLATHVRQCFAPSNGMYTNEERAQAYGTGMDWMRVSNAHSFTCLFNARRAVDWIKNHFFSKYPDLGSMHLEGFGRLQRGSDVVTSGFIAQCIRYDKDVDAGIAKTNASMDEKRKKKRRKRRRRGEAMVEDEAEEEEEGQEEEREEPTIISVPATYQVEWASDDEEDDGRLQLPGYPACKLCMDVRMSKNVELFPVYDVFWSKCKGFPTSVTLDILKKTLRLNVEEDEEGEEMLSLLESDMIIRGDDMELKRPMLSGGDGTWGKQCRQSLLSTEPDTRFEHQVKVIRLALALGLTRAGGSDMYTNERVQEYGKCMEHMEEGIKDYEDAYHMCLRDVLQNKRRGCCLHEAILFFTHIIFECNEGKWRLRPDNVHMMIQILVSDVMLALNFHDSVIGGAHNGIGGTLIVQDGGGNYRIFDKTEGAASGAMVQVKKKKPGSGADMCVGFHKRDVSLKVYHDRCKVGVEGFNELKRTTELGMVQGCCNIFEHKMNGETKQTHTIKNASSRFYATELKAGNDPASVACMQAISWLVPRQTSGLDVNSFFTTKEDEKTKARTQVEYRQATFGFLMLCSNVVKGDAVERLKTIATVTRNITSAANGLSCGNQRQEMLCIPVTNERNIKEIARPLYFTNMCTTMVTAFLQWTGVLGRVPASPLLEAVLEVFYYELDQCKDVLNPDMFNQGERSRCYQVSKARGVAMSLVMTSMEQTLEAGRSGGGAHEAIERTTLRLMTESCSPHMASWIMADTLEHMFRMDFMLVMQMLGTTLQVPTDIVLEDVLVWLRTGNAEKESLRQWWERQQPIDAAPMDTRTGLTDVGSCMYVTHVNLTAHVHMQQGMLDFFACQQVGNKLFSAHARDLQEYCQITRGDDGEKMVQCMLMNNMNQDMGWPSVFGTAESLPSFWLGRPQQPSLNLAPLRVIVTNSRQANLFVDARWLLLYCSICGRRPAQVTRFLYVSKWIEYFYHTCIPDRMVHSHKLFTGLPCPITGGGMLLVPHRASGRRTLRRHTHMIVGHNAPIGSKVVEVRRTCVCVLLIG